jgi:hypothetical protein
MLLALPALAQEKLTYQDHLLPLIENHCAKCHNPDKKKGDLDLTSYGGLMRGGGSGPIVVAGNPDGSKIFRAVTHAEEPTMPPNKPRIPDKELDIVKKWIASGLLETRGSKAAVPAKPAVDLTLDRAAIGKPDGPPPMPRELPQEPVVHTARGAVFTGLAGSPWAPLLALGGQKQVLLCHTETLELLGILPFTEGQPADVKFSRSGKLLLAGGGRGAKSGRVIVWDVVTGEKLTTVGGEYDTVLATDITSDQSRIALGGPERLVKIHSTKDGALLHKIKKHTDWVTALAFSPNGEWLASADRNGGLSMWDAGNAQEIFTLAGHKAAVTALSWRGDSKLLASSSEDGSVKLWEMEEGKQAKTWNAHNGGALSVSYAHDGKLITCGRDGKVTLWDAAGNKARSFEFFGEMPVRVAFSHDGARVFGVDFNGRVAAWSCADGNRLGELDANPAPLAARIAAVEKRIAELESNRAQPSPVTPATEAEAAKPDSPADALAAAQTMLAKLKAARAYSRLHAVREKLAALKQEQEKALAAAAAYRAEAVEAERELAAAKDSAAKSKLKAAIKAATAESKGGEATAKKLAAEIAAEQSQLDALSADYHRLKAAATPPPVQQSKR